MLEKANFNTLLIEGTFSFSKPQILPLPKSLIHLKPFLLPNETGKCSFFTHYRHFGRAVDDIVQEICAFSPRLCCIACFAYCYGESVVELANAIKKELPDTVILAGGAGVSVHPRWFLSHMSIDYTLSGEAEGTLPGFIDFLRTENAEAASVPALGWKNGHEIHLNHAALPTSSETIIPSITRAATEKTAALYTASVSRGCSMTCTFCANRIVHGNSFRHASIDRISIMLDNVEKPVAGLPVHINFEDDNLLIDWQFFVEVLHECRVRFPGVTFTAENGLDYRMLDPEKCEFLMNAGFSQFNFTIGSVAQEVLLPAGREGWLDHFDTLFTMAHNRKVPVIGYLICGLPGDTVSTIAENLVFMYKRAIITGMSLFYPVPGLRGFTDLSRFDGSSPRLACGSSAFPWNHDVSTATLVTAFRIARFINFVKQPHHDEIEKSLISRTLATKKLHTIVRVRKVREIIEVPGLDDQLAAMFFAE